MQVSRLSLLIAVFFASTIGAQTPAIHSSARFSLGLRLPIGRAPKAAQVCDGSEMEGATQRASLGRSLIYGGTAAILVSPFTGDSHAVVIAGLGLVTIVSGGVLRANSHVSEAFWQGAVSGIKIGQTTTAEVRDCLRAPNTTTSSGTDETWTYVSQTPGSFGSNVMRTLTVTFSNGIVRNVSRTESGG